MKDMKKVKNNILAEGEATGHYHQAIAGDVLEDESGNKSLITRESTDITHQEHKTIVIPDGTHRIGIVKEYDHAAEEAREVID